MIQIIAVITAIACIAVTGAAIAALRELRARLDATQARLADLEQRHSPDDLDAALAHLTSHDLRAPVATILGYQELLNEGALGDIPDDANDAIARIGIAARQLLTLLDGYFAVQHAEARRLPVVAGATSLAPIIQDVLRGSQTLAREYGTTIDLSMWERLPTLHTDAEQLRRALDLAFSASVRASPKAALAIRVEDAGDSRVTIAVSGTRIRLPDSRDLHPATPAPERPSRSVGSERTTVESNLRPEADRIVRGEPADPSTAERIKRSNARLYLADRLLSALGCELGLELAADGTTTLVLSLQSVPESQPSPPRVPR